MQKKAFPISRKDGFVTGGMDLREYYAAFAMQGLLVHNGYKPDLKEALVTQAFEIADAMLEVKVADDVQRVELE